MSSSTPFQRMRDDHARVLASLDAFDHMAIEGVAAGERLGELRAMVALLERQFDTHMSAEDEILFPALGEALPEALAILAPLRAEHHDLRSMLAGLVQVLAQPNGVARDEQITVRARDFVDLLRIHVRKEEAFVFRVAERVLPEAVLQRIAGRLQDSNPPPTGTPR